MQIRDTFLPFAKPDIDQDDIKGVVDVLESGWLSKGPKVIEFEKKLSDYLDVPHVIACNSGTSALHLAMLAGKIGPGDEVIVPSLTFCSSANVIIHVGATPVFADVDDKTLCIDPNDAYRKITDKTKAILGVHFGGRAANLTKLKEICTEKGLLLIEDAAHAIGTRYNNQLIGVHGDLVCFSFYATKNISTGEGGALVTKNDEFAEIARLYSWHGVSRNAWNRYSKEGSWHYDVMYPGFKYNMMDMQATLGLSQLAKIEVMQNKRTELASLYLEHLSKHSDYITLPERIEDETHVHSWHLFPIRIKRGFEVNRNSFIEKMKSLNIGTSVHFIPVHMHPFYKENYPTELPITENVFDEIVSLPIYSTMTKEDALDVIQAIDYIF